MLVDKHTSSYYSLYKYNKNDSKKLETFRKDLIKDFEMKAAELGMDMKYHFLE